MGKKYLGIDIGGTKCAVLVGTEQVEVLKRVEIPTDHKVSAVSYIENQLLRICSEFIEEYGGRDHFISVGVSCGGPLDDRLGIICSPPNLPGWDEIPITKIISRKLGLPAYLQNDANACAMAEWKFGAGCGCRNMIFLTFGTGLGAGLILDGHLYSGTNGMAGEVGHIRLAETGPLGYGKEGSFEGFCSGGGIRDLFLREVQSRYGMVDKVILSQQEYTLDQISAKVIFTEARKGDPLSVFVVEKCAEYLGRGLGILIDILNPERIVLGSIFVRGEDLLREKMQEYLTREVLPVSGKVCQVVPAQLGEALGDVAALSVAIVNGGEENE